MDLSIPGHKIKTFTRSLACINKFGDDLAVSALQDAFKLSTISPAQSAFCLFSFEPAFFSRYKVTAKTRPEEQHASARFLLLGKTLHDIFKQQAVSSANRITLSIPARDFERAEAAAVDNDAPPQGCRLTVTVFCPHGIKKTYKLTYQAGDSMVAIASKDTCPSSFTASPRVVKDWTDHFMLGKHGTDEITFWCTRSTCKIRSFEGAHDFNENAAGGRAARDSASLGKQSISTTLSVDTGEFDNYNLSTDETLITITLKELKAIIDYAIGIGNSLDFHFSTGGQPLLTEFETDNLSVSFVMSTNSDDPAGLQREKPDVKPRMSQMRLNSTQQPARQQSTATNASRAPTAGLASQQQRQPRDGSTVPPSQSSSRPAIGGSSRQPLFRPPDTASPEPANRSAPIKIDIDDDDDDDSLWAQMDAQDPSFSQVALNVDEGQDRPDISLNLTQLSQDASRQSQQPVQNDTRGAARDQSTRPPAAPPQDVIDMSLDDETEDSLMMSERSNRSKRSRKNWQLGLT